MTEPPATPKVHARTAAPFKDVDVAHTIVRAAEQLNFDLSDPEAFLRRIQHVEYGLSAEIEFAAILRWFGRCPIVHRLAEDTFRSEAEARWEIPDLLAIFEAQTGETFSALIEVKTTSDLELVLTKAYLEKLRAYAAMLGQPLLIAWRPREVGFWMLFDPACAIADGAKLRVDLNTALQNDLLGILAGDCFIIPKAGAGLRIEAKIAGEKIQTEDGYQAVFRISEAYLHDGDGLRVSGLPQPVLWAILSVLEHKEDVGQDSITWTFTAADGSTRAQNVLRTAAGFALREGEKINWKAIGESFDQFLSYRDLLTEASKRFGTFFSYILHVRPVTIPAFLPAAWHPKAADAEAP